MSKVESICVSIMLIMGLISAFKSGKYIHKGETLKAIYYEIMWMGMIIMVLLRN